MRRKLLAVITTALLVPLAAIAGPGNTPVAFADPPVPTTTTSTTNLSCQATTPLGPQPASQDVSFTTTHPTYAWAGTNFTISAASDPVPTGLPDNVSGFPIIHYRDFFAIVPIPAHTTFVSASLSGGFGPLGTPTVNFLTGPPRIRVDIPGPIPPNTAFQFPTINVTLTALASGIGTNVEPKLGGTSFANPGFGLTVRATLPSPYGDTDIPTACFPPAPPPIASVYIAPPDTFPPAVTITTPPNGAVYVVGQTVNADYTCDDGPYGWGVATCDGDVPNGSPIDTSSPGTKTFTVSSLDAAPVPNGPTVVTHTYTVVDLPVIRADGGWAIEGPAAAVPIPVSLSRPPETTASVDYTTNDGTAVAGVDYVTTSGTLTWGPTDPLTQIVWVPVIDDSTWKPARSFTLDLSNPSDALILDASVTGRIRDDEDPPVRVQGGQVTEGPGAQITFEVSLAGTPAAPVTVAYTTADGTGTHPAVAPGDYTPTSGTLTFTPGGPLQQTVTVDVVDDGVAEADAESFRLVATNTANSQSAEANGTIWDSSQRRVEVSIGDAAIVEADDGKWRKAEVTLSLDRSVPIPISVVLDAFDGTATSPSDYRMNRTQVNFKANEVTKQIAVDIRGDTVCEGDETFTIDLNSVLSDAATIGKRVGTVTIIDNDCPAPPSGVEVSLSDATGFERIPEAKKSGVVVTSYVTLNKAASAAVTVDLTTNDGTATANDDYIPYTGSVTIPAGRLQAPVNLTIRADYLVEGTETFTLDVTSVSGPATVAKGSGTLTILDNDNLQPSAPSGVTATTATNRLGAVDVSWTPSTVPLDSWPILTYEYQVSKNGGPFSAWVTTGNGDNPFFQHTGCGQGVSCEYRIRAVNLKGPGVDAAGGPAVGLADTQAPATKILWPRHRGNVDGSGPTTFEGDAGFANGDTPAVTVNVYACNNCVNPAFLVESLAATVSGGSWTATSSAALSPGVYTVQAIQTDWKPNTADVRHTFEVRDAVFTSPYGNGSDANPGTARQPKQTAGAAVSTAIAEGRPQVVLGHGTFNVTTLNLTTTPPGGLSILGAFDQAAGWTRPGTAGVSGNPEPVNTTISGGTTAVLVDGAITVTLNGVTVRSADATTPGSSSYGVRVINGANVTISRSSVVAGKGAAAPAYSGPAGSNGVAGCNGANSPNSTSNGPQCSPPPGGTPGGFGGAGGGFLGSGSNGGPGGNTTGGAGGAGGFAGDTGVLCVGAGIAGGGFAGGQGNPGAASAPTANTPDPASTTTWVGRTGGTGGAGFAGAGGGGGGGASCGVLFGTPGGRGGGGGGGGTGGGGGLGGASGGGSFAVFAYNATVTVQNATLTAADGGAGGTGGPGGTGGNGGNGGNGGSNRGGGGAGGTGGTGGTGGGGGAGGPSIALYHAGTGSASFSGTTFNRASVAAPGGAGGPGGNGGTGGTGGLHSAGAGPSGAAGTAGQTGATGSTGSAGLLCKRYIGGSCTS